MTETSDNPAHRVRVKREPLPGAKPWRAVVVDGATEHPAGRADSQEEAIKLGVSAARFIAAGIPWTVTE